MWKMQRRFVDVIDGRMVGRFRKRETKLRVFVVGLWLEARCLSDSDVQAVVEAVQPARPIIVCQK